MASACLQRLKGITPQGHGGSGAVLTLLLWPASGVPATDSCCTVPCCHGERVQANEALVMLDSPYALSVAASIRLAGPSPAMTPPSSQA